MLEQEVKLPFSTVEAARQAVHATGARLVVSRRLLQDRLFDTPDGRLRNSGCALRVRRDRDAGFLTFKGPADAQAAVKSREEIETAIGDARVAIAIVGRLGFVQVFLAEKYREEYALGDAHVSIDEAPIGVFVEIEGTPDVIARTAAAFGKSRADYRLESYPRLYTQWCLARGLTPGDMTFESTR
jgi:adenylate cyclase, class 2